MTMLQWQMMADEVRNDPAASYWLKNALSSALLRDPVDAYNDVEHLARIVYERHRALERLNLAQLEGGVGGH